jgi:hypothetical protein
MGHTHTIAGRPPDERGGLLVDASRIEIDEQRHVNIHGGVPG